MVGSDAGGGTTTASATDVLSAVSAVAVAQAGAENFPVALRILPKAARAQLMAAYHFSRFVDDLGDEAPGDRSALLDAVERDVRLLPDGRPDLPVVAAMRDIVVSGVGVQTLCDLIEANRQDQSTDHYDTFADLLGYCQLSAAPIGRMVLGIAGALSAANIADSDAVCAALQVLEHCQDVGEDARAGRVYLPQDELAAEQVPASALSAGHAAPGLRRVVLRQVELASALLERSGPALVGRLDGWARVAVAGYVAGGQATADALRRSGGEVLAVPVKAAKSATLRATVGLFVSSLLPSRDRRGAAQAGSTR